MKTIQILPIIAATLLFAKLSLAQDDGVLIDPSETLTRHPSATLEVGRLQSTTANDYGGFLAPRMTLVNRGNIASPAEGLLIYQTDNTPGYYLYNGSGWNRLFEGTGSTSITLNGNSFERAALTGDVTAAANSNVTTISDNAVDGTDINLSGNTIGDMMYYNGTDWVRLASSTSGRILRTNGAAAPSWSDPTGIMTVENGLTETAPATVRLGGTLTQATTITQGSYNMDFNLNGTGDMRVMDGATERVRFEDGGRVEILATTDASGTAGSGVLEIGNSLRIDDNEIITNTNATLFLNSDNAGDVQMDGGTFHMDASANRVGIGTTTPAYTLETVAGGSVSVNDGFVRKVKGFYLQDWDDDTGGSDDKYRLLGRDGAWQFYNGGVVVGNYNDGTWSDLADGWLVVEDRVGIRTTAPTEVLDVNGSVRIRGGSPEVGDVLTATSTDGTATWSAGVPLGTIVAWHKNGGAGTLPSGWEECDGSPSSRNGITIPNLNGGTTSKSGDASKGHFLRGHTSSGVFETDASNNFYEVNQDADDGGANTRQLDDDGEYTDWFQQYYSNDRMRFKNEGVETRVTNMSVVWIIKVE
ncbi:MAG: hypothetical protein K9J17_12290 [Flavobacteriales bacterium]|nr:hypothetical protein [Flavobacteriales bacterium]